MKKNPFKNYNMFHKSGFKGRRKFRSFRADGNGHSGGGNRGFRSPASFGGGGGRPNFAKRRSKLEGEDINIFIRRATALIAESPENNPANFDRFNLAPILKQNIANRGYTQPTPIQNQAIEPILAGRDVIGLASTGTGKTAAFLLPLIHKIYTDRRQRALIIVPTRELALQITEEFRSFATGTGIYSTLIIGGANMKRQISDIRRNPHVVVATPGRLKDLVSRKLIYLEDYSNIVLDEVDLMVDIGFIRDVKFFISLMPRERQSLFFSATISGKVQGIIRDFVHDPVTISVKQQETSENVDQNVIRVNNPFDKLEQLHNLLNRQECEKVLIFGRTKHGVEKLHQELKIRGFRAGAIHGNKNQGQRQRTLQSFKQNEIKILLATDVASRGLDIENVTHVINYDLPETFDDYIHRIGRTGRANKKGYALTFVNN